MDEKHFDEDFKVIRGAIRAAVLSKAAGGTQKMADAQLALDHVIDPALHVLQRLVTAIEGIEQSMRYKR